VESENGPNGDESYGDQGMGGGDSGKPPLHLNPGEWRGYHGGNDAAALFGAFDDAWNERPPEHGNKPADATIVAHGNNPITGYSVVMKGHPGGP
jgi:hypothetical protein